MDFQLGGADTLSPEQIQEREQRQQRIKASADPALLNRVERWIHHRMVPLKPSLPTAIRPQRTHFDRLADWNAGYLGVRAEFEPPYEMTRDLKEQVPQSILRDIYRPVRRQPMIEPAFIEVNADPGGRLALAEAKAALQREPLPTVEPILLVVIAEQRRRRRFLRRPWPSFRADEAPRRYSEDIFGRSEEESEEEEEEE